MGQRRHSDARDLLASVLFGCIASEGIGRVPMLREQRQERVFGFEPSDRRLRAQFAKQIGKSPRQLPRVGWNALDRREGRG